MKQLTEVYPDVLGAIFDEGEMGVYVPVVMSKKPGCGNVGRFIDGLLSKHKVVKFPNIISSRLEEMLKRRGFQLTYEWAEQYGEYVDVWVKTSQV